MKKSKVKGKKTVNIFGNCALITELLFWLRNLPKGETFEEFCSINIFVKLSAVRHDS
jgi:hypothetical protein